MDAPGILIISYYFPPNNSVGGRRWAKFSKYLAKKDYRVFVVTSEVYTSEKRSSWDNDLHPGVKVIRVNDGFPKVLLNPVKNIKDKILYRLALAKMRLLAKGNIYDPSSLMEPLFNDTILPLVQKENISNVIVTGAPFAYFYYSLQIKKVIPSVNLILDYRDLWTDSKYSFGQFVKAHQGEERFRVEKERERKVLEDCDRVVAVTEDVGELLKGHGKFVESKLAIIPNGYDEDEGISIPPVRSEIALPVSRDVITIYYLGTINCGRSYYMLFIDALKTLRADHPSLYAKLRITFWGNTNINFAKDIRESGLECITQEKSISLDDMMKKLDAVDFFLYFKREDELPNSFATKFYDYLRFRKPVLILSPEGAVTQYIRENKIGVVLSEQEMGKQLAEMFDTFLHKGIPFDHHLDFSEHSIRLLTERLTAILK